MTWHGEKWPPSGAGRPGQQRAAARGGLSSFSSPPLGLPAALPAADLQPRSVESVSGDGEVSGGRGREEWRGGGCGSSIGKREGRSVGAVGPESSFVE